MFAKETTKVWSPFFEPDCLYSPQSGAVVYYRGFFEIAGKNPERSGFVGKHYNRFGHANEQMEEARRFGMQIGEALKGNIQLASINFNTDTALP